MIWQESRRCTVNLVAQRQDKVLSFCNGVLVMHNGRVVETGEPAVLRRMYGRWFVDLSACERVAMEVVNYKDLSSTGIAPADNMGLPVDPDQIGPKLPVTVNCPHLHFVAHVDGHVAHVDG